jgi:hypothetical protein
MVWSGLPMTPELRNRPKTFLLLKPYTRAISIAMRVDDDIINAISDGPTPEYAQHYRSVNASLDRITSRLVQCMGQYIWENVMANCVTSKQGRELAHSSAEFA